MSKTKSLQVARDDVLATRKPARTWPCSRMRCGVGGEPGLAGVAEVRRILTAELAAAFARERVRVAMADRRTVPDAR